MLQRLRGVAAAVIIGSSCAVFANPPALFVTVPVDEAIATATRDEKLAIVHATAVWCGPCKMMEKTTYADQRVTDWFKANAVGVQFDVDKEPDTAKRFKIRAMPTVIALRGGEEIARSVGYLSAEQMITWLNDVKAGKIGRNAPPPNVDEMSMQKRMQHAQELAFNGKHAEALQEYLWLWDNMVLREWSMSGVRGSFLAMQMQALAQEHAPAKKAFEQLRDRSEEVLKTDDRTFEVLDDWIVLNGVVGDTDRTLAWFDRHKDDPDFKRTWRRVHFRIEPLLREEDRLSDLGAIMDAPGVRLKRDAMMLESSGGMVEAARSALQNHQRGEMAETYSLYLVVEREDDATKYKDGVIELVDTPEMRIALVEAALEVGQPRAEHAELLKQAAAAGSDTAELSKRLEAALAVGAK